MHTVSGCMPLITCNLCFFIFMFPPASIWGTRWEILTRRARWNVSLNPLVLSRVSSWYRAHKKVFGKGRQVWKEVTGRTICLLPSSGPIRFARLAACHRTVPGSHAAQRLTELLLKPRWRKTCCSLRKAFSGVLTFYFNVKHPPCSDETATIAATTPV